jgi:flagellar biosynthesis/type III secretory pathway M-ring protein FliF/YscJ
MVSHAPERAEREGSPPPTAEARVAVLIVILALVLLVAVIAVIAAPLLRAREAPRAQDAERQELEAEREAKYREIRDAELDFRTGKLSCEDHAAIDAALRSEALDILNRLERCGNEDSRPEEATGERSTPRDA